MNKARPKIKPLYYMDVQYMYMHTVHFKQTACTQNRMK